MITTVMLWILLVLNVLVVITAPAMVGRQRNPITAGIATIQVLFALAVIAGLTLALMRQ